MNSTFEKLYRGLGRVTFGTLLTALTMYGLTLICALLGFSHAAASFGPAAASVAYVFVALLIVFLISSIVAAVIRWLDRRDQIGGSTPR